MRRTPEPELMKSEAQAVSYAQGDFSESNQIFVSNLLQQASLNSETKILIKSLAFAYDELSFGE